MAEKYRAAAPASSLRVATTDGGGDEHLNVDGKRTAHAQVPAHLRCYEIKDQVELDVTIELDVPPFGPALRCAAPLPCRSRNMRVPYFARFGNRVIPVALEKVGKNESAQRQWALAAQLWNAPVDRIRRTVERLAAEN